MAEIHENVIEFISYAETATVTFSQKKYVSKLKRLAEEHPNEVQIIHQNEDGTVVAHVPIEYIKISRPRQLSEEQYENAKRRLSEMRERKAKKNQ